MANWASKLSPRVAILVELRGSTKYSSGTFIPGNTALGGPKVNEDYGDIVPSRPHDGLQGSRVVPGINVTQRQSISGAVDLAGEGDFGTIIVHAGDGKDRKPTQTSVLNAIEASPGGSCYFKESFRKVIHRVDIVVCVFDYFTTRSSNETSQWRKMDSYRVESSGDAIPAERTCDLIW
ncbi:hypothetical protein Vadar_023242 [Vaccinium darrowii]|nr:hypothetical protein Vadar_023242 [Vaccinium darrowii]